MSENVSLSAKQTKALTALLGARTIAEAASTSGLTDRTIYRWLSEDERFKAAYLAARRQVMSLAILRLQQAAVEAVEALRAVMADDDESGSSRVAASKAVLELGLRGLETEDLESRIAALEKRAAHSTNGRYHR
jgi:hypothetical protein